VILPTYDGTAPIRYRERRLGESKKSARIALEAAWKVPAPRSGSRGWRPLEAEARPADAVVHEG
jgi:dolichol-phosphate mannosyltransferase